MNNGPLEAKPNMGERLRKSRERIEELRAEAQAKARRAARITNNYAHDHPWRIACTTAALAFVAGFIMNTKRPKRIVVKAQRPTIKVNPPRPVRRHSPFETVNALLPIVMFGLKTYVASRPKNKTEPHPPYQPEASAPVP